MSLRLPVCRTDDLPPGSAKVLHTDLGMVSVFNVDGRFYAIDDLCPHMRESLGQGHLDGCIVSCGMHGWRFDVRSGASPDFEGIRVATYTVQEEDGELYLLLAGDAEALDWDDAADPDDIEKDLFD